MPKGLVSEKDGRLEVTCHRSEDGESNCLSPQAAAELLRGRLFFKPGLG